MSYCINPECAQPKNPTTEIRCQCCGSSLLLQDRYRVLRALGRGGFGATFLARNMLLPGKPPCVIKQLRPSIAEPHLLDMARNLFQREAKILGEIGNHPQLPRLLAYFEVDQEFFLVQEFINGITLQQEVKRGGPFTEAGVKQFLSEILVMVQYLHHHQVIHRDIKPANIIRRNQDKKLVLIDFGAVKDKVNPLQETSSEQTALTAYAVGTPGYAPPEQMAMRPVYASDIYALGVTCVYLLSGKSPKELNYDPVTGELLWRNHVHISDHFADVLQKMLEISVRYRYQSVEAILRDLDLQPYLDSLAQNMTYSAPASSGLNSSSKAPLNGGSSSRVVGSPSLRMAAAIRARRERGSSTSGSKTTKLDSYNLRQNPLPSSSQGKHNSGQILSSQDIKERYLKGRRDFSSQTFTDLDMQRTALTEINFNQSKLSAANFQGSDLTKANFGRSNLRFANLRNAKLVKAYFHCADLEGADLRGADLAQACLSNANLRGANLCGADLTGALVGDDQLVTAHTNWYTTLPSGRRGSLS